MDNLPKRRWAHWAAGMAVAVLSIALGAAGATVLMEPAGAEPAKVAVQPEAQNLTAPCLQAPEPPVPTAAVDYFLKIDGIDGDASNPAHRDEIEILSWSWGVSRASKLLCDSPRRSASFTELRWTKQLDKASPKLAQYAINGQRAVTAVLTAYRRGGDEPLFAFEMKNVLVTSYTVSGSAGEVPMENLSLNFEEIKF